MTIPTVFSANQKQSFKYVWDRPWRVPCFQFIIIQTALEQPMILLTCTFEQVNLEKFTLVSILFHQLCPHEIS